MTDENTGLRRDYDVPLVTGLVVLLFVTAAMSRADTPGWWLIIAGCAFLVLVSRRHPGIGTVLLLAFVLRAAVAVLGQYVIELPDTRSDAENFENWAWIWASGGIDNVLANFTAGTRFFAWALSFVYLAFGHAPLAATMVNVFLGTGTVLNVYLIGREFRENKHATRNALVAALFPTLVLYSAILLREAPFHFVLTLMGLLFLRWQRDPRRFHLLLVLMPLGVLAGMVHTLGAIALAVLLVGIACVALRSTIRNSRYIIYALVVLAIPAAVAYMIYTTGIGLGKLDGMTIDIEWIRTVQEKATRGRTAFPEHLIIHEWGEVWWKAPVRGLYVLFAPFPWLVRTPLDVAGLLDATLYVAMVALLARHGRSVPRSAGAAFLILMLLVLVGVMSIGVSNYGTALRHRAKFVPILIALLPSERWNEAAARLRSATSALQARLPRPPERDTNTVRRPLACRYAGKEVITRP